MIGNANQAIMAVIGSRSWFRCSDTDSPECEPKDEAPASVLLGIEEHMHDTHARRPAGLDAGSTERCREGMSVLKRRESLCRGKSLLLLSPQCDELADARQQEMPTFRHSLCVTVTASSITTNC